MKQLMPFVLVLGLAWLGVSAVAAPSSKKEKAMEALRELNDFIGDWKGAGNPDKARLTPRDPIWEVKTKFGWRFKGDDAWLVLNITGDKTFKGGQVRWMPAKKAYQSSALTADGKTIVFEGK